MNRRRIDFNVIPSDSGKTFAVMKRLSEWDGSEWHWLDDCFYRSFRTREAAQAKADELNAEISA